MEEEKQRRPVGSVRLWEAVVAIAFLVFGAVVVWDSRRLGASWGSDGPQAGYFPFYIGAIICVASIVNLLRALKLGAKGRRPFVHWAQLRMVLTVMIPSAVYVALIAPIGIYAASIAFIAFFMRLLGKYSWPKIAAVSIGTMVVFFLMFEVWFQVPLPKGPIEAMIGYR